VSSGALLRDREDARLELARITSERDAARAERDKAEQRAVEIHERLCAAIDREAKALLRVELLEIELHAKSVGRR